MSSIFHAHGGDLDAIERQYKIPKSEIIDFSGNINPLGFPKSVKNAIAENIDIVSMYPDKNYTALKKSIANYTNADFKNISVGNGSTELISVFIKSVNAKKAVILGPAYSEYENELKISNSNFEYFPLKEEYEFNINVDSLIKFLTPDIDLFIACNPNNPTGTAINIEQLDKILCHCKTNNTFVMIDETYIEFSEDINSICAIPLTKKYDNLFVIRGTAKFFAAPGIRLGYGITSNSNFHKLLQKNQNPWSVNILAAFAGERMFLDEEYKKQTWSLITTERKKALAEFKTWKNIKSYNSSSNFILLKLLTSKTNAADIFDKMLNKKMLIRDAASFKFLDESYLRFCLLSPQHNAMFIKELKSIVE